jgi:uncharacterized protein YkwD
MPRMTQSTRARLGVAAAATLVLSLAPATAATAAPSAACVSTTVTAVQKRVVADVNAARKNAGKPALTASRSMHAVANAWSEKQAAAGRMSHNPDYARQIPAGWTSAAENVAYGYAPSKVTRAWLDSPGHRANILGSFTHVGVGVDCSKAGKPYYTQVFGKY